MILKLALKRLRLFPTVLASVVAGHSGNKEAVCLQVLRSLPFLKGLPDPVFEALLASGNLVRYGKGDSIWSPLRPANLTARGGHLKAEGGMACEGNGIFVVMAGLVKSSYTTAEGRTVVRDVSCFAESAHLAVQFVAQYHSLPKSRSHSKWSSAYTGSPGPHALCLPGS